MPRPIKVVLTPLELAIAELVGTTRQRESVQAGRKDQHGFDGVDGEDKHVSGAAGEIALAKALGLYPGFTINTFKAADLGPNIQVRTRSERNYNLYVRPNESDEEIFVVVLDTSPEFLVLGWLKGVDAKRVGIPETFGNRPMAHFVQNDLLRDISELKVEPTRLPVDIVTPTKHPF